MSKRKRKLRGSSEPIIRIGHYAILYMDVLNQREKLARINRLPENDEEKESFISLLKDTYGVIDGFQILFEAYLSQTRSRSSSLTIPKIGRDYFKRVVGEDVGRTLLLTSEMAFPVWLDTKVDSFVPAYPLCTAYNKMLKLVQRKSSVVERGIAIRGFQPDSILESLRRCA